MSSPPLRKKISSHDGIELYYERHGPRTNEPPLFFLHGIGGDLDAWRFVRDAFLEKGFSTIAMDLRGHGYSTHPRARERYRIENFVEDVVAILDSEKIEKVHLVGHCFGAVIAAHVALARPERLERLAIISGTYGPPNYLRPRFMKAAANGFINAAAFVSPPPIYPGHSKYPTGKFHKDYELFGLARTLLRNSWRSYLLTTEEIVNLDLEPKLGAIKTPTLVIAGEKDSIFPLPILERIHGGIPGSRFEVIPDANHVVVLNNVEHVVGALNDFLSGTQ